jgi:cyclic pyranopterin phosphate synthase
VFIVNTRSKKTKKKTLTTTTTMLLLAAAAPRSFRYYWRGWGQLPRFYSSTKAARQEAQHGSGIDEILEKLTHVSATTNLPQMVAVGEKIPSRRVATARSYVRLPPHIYAQLWPAGGAAASSEVMSKKGPVLATAIIAGTLGVKQTAALIPFCHPLSIEDCRITIEPIAAQQLLEITCRVATTGKTGVEMEAMTGCSVAALTIYDMLKGLSHDIIIESTRLLEKSGGKADFRAA